MLRKNVRFYLKNSYFFVIHQKYNLYCFSIRIIAKNISDKIYDFYNEVQLLCIIIKITNIETIITV